VLLIVTDDQRWDTLPYMPAVQAELVGKGVTFANSFTVSPLCCPARATILTGTYPHTHGVWANNGPWSAPRQFDDDWHLGVWLQQAGYRTGMFGKFFNNWGHPARAPGFDRWFAFHSPGGTRPYFDYPVDADGGLRWYGKGEGDYSTDVLPRRRKRSSASRGRGSRTSRPSPRTSRRSRHRATPTRPSARPRATRSSISGRSWASTTSWRASSLRSERPDSSRTP